MGWIASVPGCFGNCLIKCIEQVIEDDGLLLREGFREILGAAASDWCTIAKSLNGGNDRHYNLCRMGSRINDIGHHCFNPTLRDGSINKRIDWKAMLEDIKWVSEVVLYEMQRNLIAVDPHGTRDVEIIQWGETKKYETFVPNETCAT